MGRVAQRHFPPPPSSHGPGPAWPVRFFLLSACHLSVGASSEPVYELTDADRALAPVLRDGDRRVADAVVTMLAGAAA